MKKVNYTEEQAAELVMLYVDAEDKEAILDELALHFSKPKKSIIGKLSKEGVYEKKNYVSKRGLSPVTKKELIHRLSETLEADVDKLQGLEKVLKQDLEYLISVIKLRLGLE